MGPRRGGVERHAGGRGGVVEETPAHERRRRPCPPGNPAQADSQIYVTLADRPELNGRYTIIGAVSAGDGVPARLERGDLILRMSVRE